MSEVSPRYPVYVISKGRAHNRGWYNTARYLIRDGVPFRLVVEPQEVDAYADAYGRERLLILPFSDLGFGSIPARNWVWEHARESGAARHWILDDNIAGVVRRYHQHRISCNAGPAFACVEDFIDRYENVAIAGLNYEMFCPTGQKIPPFRLNVHVYSCLLIRNDLPFRWRGRYNEDTDLCLQVLSAGWCTVLINAFLTYKPQTMTTKGGNTDELYKGDGRLKMARSLERMWPGVVTVDRRYDRPQHVVKDAWKRFDTPLKLRPGVDLADFPATDEYGLTLEQVRPIKSPVLKTLVADYAGSRPITPERRRAPGRDSSHRRTA